MSSFPDQSHSEVTGWIEFSATLTSRRPTIIPNIPTFSTDPHQSRQNTVNRNELQSRYSSPTAKSHGRSVISGSQTAFPLMSCRHDLNH
jgi:hypothetical protein